MQEKEQNYEIINENVNAWEQYVSRVSRLGGVCASTYPDAGKNINQIDNKDTTQPHLKANQSKKTKTKHLLQLLTPQDSVQNTSIHYRLTKQHLICSIMSNLSTCSKIDSQMTTLLQGMEAAMNKWEKMRREEVVKLRLNEVWDSTNIYSHESNAQFFQQQQEVKMERYTDDKQYHSGRHMDEDIEI